MALSADDYLAEQQGLLPPGPAWPEDDDAFLTRILTGLSQEFARIDARATQLIDEADSRTTTELLPDQERVAGLPDACGSAVATTLEGRRAALTAKLTTVGGLSRQHYIDMAALLGYTVTIKELRPFVCARSRCGDPLNGSADARFVWKVSVPTAVVTYFRAGQSRCGDALGSFSRAADLECKLELLKPAHTDVIVSYSGV